METTPGAGGDGGVRAPREVQVPDDINDPETNGKIRTLAANVDRAVDEVFSELALKELFTSGKALKMGEKRFERWDNMLAEARAETSERILQKTYDQIRRERTPEWKDVLARKVAEVEDVVLPNRAQAARMELQYSQGPRGEPLERPGLKLSRTLVKEAYGESVVGGLPRGMFGADGVGADDLAPLLGYDSGAELLSDMMDLEAARIQGGFNSSKDHVKAVIQAEAERLAREEVGYDVSREGLIAAAREQAVLPKVESLLASELADFANELGVPFDKDGVKLVAKQSFERLPVKEAMRVKSFERGMWSTGERALKALEKGDPETAFVARQQQLINFYQLEMSHQLRAVATRSQKEFKRLAKNPTMAGLAQPFLNHIHTYLQQWGYRVNREPQELAESLMGLDLQGFVDEARLTNPNFPVVPEVQGGMPLENLNVVDYLKVADFIHGMKKYGRELQKANKEEARGDRDAIIQEAVGGIPTKPPSRRWVSADGRGSLPDRFLGQLQKYDAAHRKVADFVEWFDKGDPLGLWAQNTWIPMYKGADQEGLLRREVYEPVAKAWRAIPGSVKGMYNRKLPGALSINGVEAQLYRRNIVPMALYSGTAESLEKAAKGMGLDEATFLDIINENITPSEVAFVETIWKQFDALAPKVSEVLRRMTGEGLRRVEASPVELGGQKLRGGYVPLRYNRNPQFNPEVARWEAEQDAKLEPDGVDQLFAALSPNKGFSLERTNFVGLVDLDMQSIAGLFDSHIKYASYAQAVSDVRKFAYHPLVQKAIVDNFGEAYTHIIPGWLGGIVKPFQTDERLISSINGFFNGLARNMTAGTLVASYGTLIAQSAGVANAVAVLSDGNPVAGVGRMLGGYGKFLGAISDVGFGEGGLQMRGLHAIFERSEFMRERFGSLEQNMTDALMELEDFTPGMFGVKKNLKAIQRFGYQAIGWTEFITVSGPQWIAAEQKALAEGKTAEQAVMAANRSVVKGQGSGRRVDLASIQRAQGIMKLMYSFQSYFNQGYQLSVDMWRNFTQGGEDSRYNKAKGLLLVFSVLMLGSVIGKWQRGDDWNPEDMAFDAMRPLFGINTGVRGMERIAASLREGKQPREVALGDDLFTRAWEIIAKDVELALKWNAVNEDGEPKSRGRVFQTLANNGLLLGIPGSAQIGRTGEYLRQLDSGEQTPEGWTDIYLGLTYGPQPEQKPEGGE